VPVCRRVPVSRVARSGFKNPAHAFSFFLFKDAKHTDRVFFDRAGTFFFFSNKHKKKLTFFLVDSLKKYTQITDKKCCVQYYYYYYCYYYYE